MRGEALGSPFQGFLPGVRLPPSLSLAPVQLPFDLNGGAGEVFLKQRLNRVVFITAMKMKQLIHIQESCRNALDCAWQPGVTWSRGQRHRPGRAGVSFLLTLVCTCWEG